MQVAKFGRHAVDAESEPSKYFRSDHHRIPQAVALEIAQKIFVDDREFTRQVGLDEQVLERRFDAEPTPR